MLNSNSYGRRFFEANSRFMSIMRNYSPLEGLSHGQFMLLVFISSYYETHKNEDPLKISVIARRTEKAAPSITQKVDELEALGLAERFADPRDRRVTYVKLTEKGNEQYLSASKMIDSVFERVANELGHDKMDNFLNLQTAFFDALAKVYK